MNESEMNVPFSAFQDCPRETAFIITCIIRKSHHVLLNSKYCLWSTRIHIFEYKIYFTRLDPFSTALSLQSIDGTFHSIKQSLRIEKCLKCSNIY
ncbi:hypothetical protein Y032_0068g231 [Ancylostoma ceylanicum]|uniref:Uncharacterized protein n=1 Tax=Ancylostoma ceylanicum TaxID=53326 RepID=A0A016TYW7_9BILA|nr:hypothetical protein Y032_0068g231 [Ancylostoma ceylanicum]